MPSTAFIEASLTHPCGHISEFADACLRRDHFACPTCGLRWHMRQDPPKRHPSGWIEPGRRHLVIDQQGKEAA